MEFDEGMRTLHDLMAKTLRRWAPTGDDLPAGEEALVQVLCDGYLIDNDTVASLHRLYRWQARQGQSSYSDRLQAGALLEEMLELFRSLLAGPTLGKRHDAIIPRWMAGESLTELAESRGVDEQRILVLLHEVARYYDLAGLDELQRFLATRM